MINVVVVTAFLLATSAATPNTCTVVSRPWVRSPNSTYVVAVGSADSVIASRWQPHYFNARLERVDTGAAVPVYGQVAQITNAGGSASERIQEQKAIVVFWGSGGMCERIPPLRAMPIASGREVFLEGTLRAQAAWVNGAPTIDVHLTRHLHFPHEWNEDRNRVEKLLGGRPLTAREYFRLYERLPYGPHEALDSTLVREGRKLLRWAEQNPLLSAREPARSILQAARADLAKIPESPPVLTFLRRITPYTAAATYSAWWPSGEHLITVSGPAARAQFGHMVVAFDYLTGSERGVGVPCGGFILDSDGCRQQPIVTELTVWRGALGYVVAGSGQGWTAEIAFTGGLAYLQNKKSGLTTRARVNGEGGAIEIGLSPTLVRRIGSSPVSVSATLFAARFFIPEQDCRDCYIPFSTFETFGASVGLRYAIRH